MLTRASWGVSLLIIVIHTQLRRTPGNWDKWRLYGVPISGTLMPMKCPIKKHAYRRYILMYSMELSGA